MATLTFKFDLGDISEEEMFSGFASAYQYQAEVPDTDNPGTLKVNPETLSDFTHRKIGDYILDIIGAQRRNVAVAAAVASIEKPRLVELKQGESKLEVSAISVSEVK